jgi:hypothetical protein
MISDHEKRILILALTAMLVTIAVTVLNNSLSIWSYLGLCFPFVMVLIYFVRKSKIQHHFGIVQIAIILSAIVNTLLIIILD